jgi:hypothetical protein
VPSEAAPADSPDKALLTTRSTQRLVLPGLWLSPIAILQKQSEHQTHTDLCVTTCAVFCLEFTSVQLVTAAPLPVGQHTATQQPRRARLGRPSALIDQASVPESEESLEELPSALSEAAPAESPDKALLPTRSTQKPVLPG